ncbi:GNAT family N-acetyltransferase [Virgibacillus doumboii]|uniref:GNAT family N-acetyltransferase n=1 Tax=Virgibacillus doumboii TaxID=2697503 RepID=UPI0013DFF518|nr:GNAT family N-acetyltransferase [Virgibacillus doumboii]
MTTINKGENKFYVGEDEQNPLGEITFKQSGDNVLTVDHTYVSDELRGQGVAGKLVEKVVNYAREEGKQINPTCPYAEKKIKNTPEYQGVLVEH